MAHERDNIDQMLEDADRDYNRIGELVDTLRRLSPREVGQEQGLAAAKELVTVTERWAAREARLHEVGARGACPVSADSPDRTSEAHTENANLSLANWIAHVFDHPVADPAWHFSRDAPEWEDSPEHIVTLIADTFEQSGELLAQYSDEQLDQGFWYLVCSSEFMRSLVDYPEVPIAVRLRALRSIVPVFEQVMAVRCSPHLFHFDEPGANPLNSACYMWWDMISIFAHPDEPERAEFDSEVLVILRRLLAIPHDACRESALHGLGHWARDYPQVAEIIDEFLRGTPNLRPELVAYAELAKIGYVQ